MKLYSAVYELATGAGAINGRLREALLKLEGFDLRILNEEDKDAFRSLPPLIEAHFISEEKAKQTAKNIFQLFDHVFPEEELS